ncbi:hypothetical protein I4F81_000471 [Pyropia yezoensis]|uniref:Uncharacterized protein n=1 Tax=Pyropia yezoensis TaxID=2788 RepID=A0ACC3BJ76_PYRYE|nr:hypothetical protein I4F81_000471 [Neopyropia yezoensis]
MSVRAFGSAVGVTADQDGAEDGARPPWLHLRRPLVLQLRQPLVVHRRHQLSLRLALEGGRYGWKILTG